MQHGPYCDRCGRHHPRGGGHSPPPKTRRTRHGANNDAGAGNGAAAPEQNGQNGQDQDGLAIQEIAARHGTEPAQILKVAAMLPALKRRLKAARVPEDVRIHPDDAGVIGTIIDAGRKARDADPALASDTQEETNAMTGQPVFRGDRTANPKHMIFRRFQHRLEVHPDVPDRLRAWPHLHRRLGIILQHLAAHGRSTVVKGCKNDNRGWRRTPLGGNHGMQFYLWWTLGSSHIGQALDAGPEAVLIRAARHHDDHTPLEPGRAGDYLSVTAPDELIDDIAGEPWTADQLNFVTAKQPVRLVIGRPGSGKSTVLWKAVEARTNERVLYLTWSSALTRQAGERFESFAPVGTNVIARDFTTFLGEAAGADVERQTLAESRRLFDRILAKVGRDAGPWARRPDALHGELRAIYLGQAVPGDENTVTEHGIGRMADDAYLDLRGEYDGVGEKAARSLLRVTHPLMREPARVREVFPEIVAANEAYSRLAENRIPAGLEKIDRIVVDEIQDLTLVETAVVVELCRAVYRSRGKAPALLMAGDAGQTVRPTGFEWGPLTNLLTARLQTPEEHHLREHLRCPARIAEVVERASDWYSTVDKENRPTKQDRDDAGEHVDAQLIHTPVPDTDAAVRLLEQLEDADRTVVLVPGSTKPKWLPKRLESMVLTPAEAKGLEYQTVCVLDPGRTLRALQAEDDGYGRDAELDQPATRTAIDHLRVTLSRATETLVFIDVAADADAQIDSAEMLGDPAPYEPADLVEHLTNDAVSPEERVTIRIDDARRLIDGAPARAWQRACQAVRLLGDPSLPNGIPDTRLRAEARATLLETAARLMMGGHPAELDRDTIMAAAQMTVSDRTKDPDPPEKQGQLQDIEWALLDHMSQWLPGETSPGLPTRLLDTVRLLRQMGPKAAQWAEDGLAPAAQALRDGVHRAAACPGEAPAFAKNQTGEWLEISGYTGEAALEAKRLHVKAFDALVTDIDRVEQATDREARLESADLVLKTITPDEMRLGRLREAQNRPEEAAAAYKAAGRPKEALRMLRRLGAWKDAVELADGHIRTDLEWLVDYEKVVSRRPKGQHTRLKPAEREHLEKLTKTIRTEENR